MCLKKLWVYLKEYKTESILAPLFKLLEVVFDLLVPVVVAKIIDIGIANNDHGYIVKMFLVLILMAAVGLSCSFTAQYFAARASVGCATNLRQAVFDHIQGFSFTELDTIGTDTLITRMTDDIPDPERHQHGTSSSSEKSVYRNRFDDHGIYDQL